MSKITISAVLTVLRLIISLLLKVVRLGYSIVDLVDDGCLNNSVERPQWLSTVISAINSAEDVLSHLNAVEDEVYQSVGTGQN